MKFEEALELLKQGKKVIRKDWLCFIYFGEVEGKTTHPKELIARISAVAGTIQDCSDLHIAATGQLNGVVIGDKAHVNVETVGAGGYNIQKIPLSYASS